MVRLTICGKFRKNFFKNLMHRQKVRRARYEKMKKNFKRPNCLAETYGSFKIKLLKQSIISITWCSITHIEPIWKSQVMPNQLGLFVGAHTDFSLLGTNPTAKRSSLTDREIFRHELKKLDLHVHHPSSKNTMTLPSPMSYKGSKAFCKNVRCCRKAKWQNFKQKKCHWTSYNPTKT